VTPGFEKKKGFLSACTAENLVITQSCRAADADLVIPGALVEENLFFLIFFLKKSNFPPNFSKCPPALPAAGPIAERGKNAIFQVQEAV